MIRLCNEAFLHRNRMDIQGNVYKRVGEELNIDELESRKVCVRSPKMYRNCLPTFHFKLNLIQCMVFNRRYSCILQLMSALSGLIKNALFLSSTKPAVIASLFPGTAF